MNSKSQKIISFDVMGSDNGLQPAIAAAFKLLKLKADLRIIFAGDEALILQEISKYKFNKDQFEIVHASEVIKMTEGPLEIRRKKDSSMVKAVELVSDGKTDAVVTGGSTAAYLAACHFILKEFDQIERPAFMPVMPTIDKNRKVVMLDCGANLENSANDLLNYAIMASIYVKAILKVENPVVKLLNIGEESSKGKEYHREAYKLLANNSKINFKGNIEARYIVSGDCDIIVTDGYTGNIALKSAEGMGMNLFKVIRKALTKNLKRKIASLFLKKGLKEIKDTFDYKNHAGAIVLGVSKTAFKSHGSSDEQSFFATLQMTYEALENNVIENIIEGLKSF